MRFNFNAAGFLVALVFAVCAGLIMHFLGAPLWAQVGVGWLTFFVVPAPIV